MSLHKRKSCSKWKRSAVERIAARDGHCCAKCRIPHRMIWRRQGLHCGEQWGEDPWQTARSTNVIQTSNLELDHKVRLRDGGTNDDDNLWLLCVDCHKTKTSAERSAHLKAMFAEARA